VEKAKEEASNVRSVEDRRGENLPKPQLGIKFSVTKMCLLTQVCTLYQLNYFDTEI